MSEKMSDAPIFYTAAQITFNPVMDIDQSISKLQSIWRSRFPDFSQQAMNQIQFNLAASGEESKVKQSLVPRWHFKDIRGTSGLMLTPNSLVFHTTHYGTSVEFIETLTRALEELDKVISLTYIDAVGFRTLDAVIPEQDRELKFFIKQSLLGLYPVLEGTLKHSVWELALQRGQTQLASRCMLLNGKIGIPADLFPIQLAFQGRVQAIDGLHAILDNDAIRTERFTFDLAAVHLRLREVKSVISDAFYKAVTDDAITHWKARRHDSLS